MLKQVNLVPEVIEKRILLIRGQKVILDFHLAELYGVETKSLKRAVRRNKDRFPGDFCFELTSEETKNLRYHFDTSSWGGRRHLSYAFTEQGVAMLSSVLNSKRAIQVNIEIMRAFVKLRELLSTHKELALKLKQLEMKIEKHDEEIHAIFEAIRQLMIPPEKPKRQIGFKVEETRVKYGVKRK
jgi:phage regulator Rha-like protein